jgi:L-arabinose transport system ATP-binding protein
MLINSELPEVLGLSDRIYVMQNGRITGEVSRENATEDTILELAMADDLSSISEKTNHSNHLNRNH